MYQSIVIEAKKKLVSRANHLPARYLGSHELNNSIFFLMKKEPQKIDLFFLGGNPKGSARKNLILKKLQNEKTWKREAFGKHIFFVNQFLLLSM